MIHPDLTSLEFGHRVLTGIRYIGWLSDEDRLPYTSPPAGLLASLEPLLLTHATNRMRSRARCPFCRDLVTIDRDGTALALGGSEIWIPASAGPIYVAPDLVFHYINAHGYAPPQEFVDAVMEQPVPNWNANDFANRLRWQLSRMVDHK